MDATPPPITSLPPDDGPEPVPPIIETGARGGAISARTIQTKTSRRRRRAAPWPTLMGFLLATAACAAGLAWLALRPAGMPAMGAAATDTAASSAPAVSDTAKPDEGGAGAEVESAPIVPREAQWQSPTQGKPLDLRLLPAGVQMVGVMRPRELLATAEGRKFVAGLGPLAAWPAALPLPDVPRPPTEIHSSSGSAPLTAVLRRTWDEVERLEMGCWEGRDGALRCAFAVESTRPYEASDWEALQLAPVADAPGCRERDGWAWWSPADASGKRLVVAPREEMADIVSAANQPPALRRDLEAVLADSDEQRHLNIALTRDFLTAAGEALWSGPWAKLQPPFEALLGEAWQAALVSTHLGEDWFCELRLLNRAEVPAKTVAGGLRRAIADQPTQFAERIAAAPSDPYGQPLLARVPLMLETWQRWTKVSVERRLVVARSYLPAEAAHNLAWAAQLWSAAGPGAGAMATAAPTNDAQRSIAERLQEVISLKFPLTTFEDAVAIFSAQVQVPVVLVGQDLQLEGITKNQSFSLEIEGVPASSVLNQILRLASPDGKLTYVENRDEQGAAVLYVTTHVAADKRGQRLSVSPAEAGSR